MTTPISDPEKYLTEMSKGVFDKLFFAPIIEADAIVDYGCADGTLARAHARMFPAIPVIGFDKDMDMIRKARFETTERNITYTNNWHDVERWACKYQNPAIILSSVLHEVYSYCDNRERQQFEEIVWYSGFKCIVIRDMMHHRSMIRASRLEDVARARQMIDEMMVDSHEERFGSIEENVSLVHLLLKYRFKENWQREVREDYLAVDVDRLTSSVPNYYEPIYFRHYTLPFVRRKIKEDLGIHFMDRTHVQLIYERNINGR